MLGSFGLASLGSWWRGQSPRGPEDIRHLRVIEETGPRNQTGRYQLSSSDYRGNRQSKVLSHRVLPRSNSDAQHPWSFADQLSLHFTCRAIASRWLISKSWCSILGIGAGAATHEDHGLYKSNTSDTPPQVCRCLPGLSPAESSMQHHGHRRALCGLHSGRFAVCC